MFDTVPSYLRTNLSPFIIIGVFLVAAILAYLLYRRTIPPLANSWRITLSIIRGIAVTLILLLLFTPQLILVWQQRVTDKVALVIDRSASMGLLERGASRLSRGEKIVEDLLEAMPRQTEVSLYAFNTDTMSLQSPAIDSAQFATDIDAALTHVIDKEKDLTALILLSDGNFTSGRNPLYTDALLRCKVYTVGIGDTLEIPDLLIADVQANKIVYQNKITPVQVNLMARGFTSKETLLQIKAEGKVLAAQKVKINTEGGIIPISLSIKPEQVGLQQFEISVAELPGEVLLDNNRHLLILEVLKSKIKAGMLASQPDFDVKFLHLLLAANPDLQVELAVMDQGIKSPVLTINQVLDSVDVLVLHDFPALSTSRENLSIIEKLLIEQKVPSLLLFGVNSSRVNWDFIKRFYSLPQPKFLNPVLKTQAMLTDIGKNLPLLNIFSTDQENLNFWQKCPPIEYPFEKVETDNSLRIALETVAPAGKEKIRAAVLLLEQNAGRRNAYLLGSGFWRWHFMLAEDRMFREGWQTIIKNIIRWLSMPDGSSSNVLLSTNKRSYQVGETVRINTEVYDGDYRPVDDGMVQFKVTGPAGAFDLDGGLIATGTYTSDFQLLSEGDYTIEAQALHNDVPLGQASTRIVCSPVNIEFLYTRQDDQLLRKLADKSGGQYVDETNYRALLPDLNFPVRYQEVTKTFEIWQKASLLLLIIFLLSVEWFIRKRLGLA